MDNKRKKQLVKLLREYELEFEGIRVKLHSDRDEFQPLYSEVIRVIARQVERQLAE